MKLKQQNCKENRNLIFFLGRGRFKSLLSSLLFCQCKKQNLDVVVIIKVPEEKNKQARKKDVKTGRKGESDYDLMV